MIISNVYIPPANSCSNGYHSSIEHLLTTPDTLILGDFNAQHPSWYSRSTDTRGRKIADSINGSDYGILNWDSSTKVPPNAELSSPDVSLASASLITSCSWQTLSTLSSDHLPILIRLQMKTPSNPGLRRTYVNLKKANWDRYRQEVVVAVVCLPRPMEGMGRLQFSDLFFFFTELPVPPQAAGVVETFNVLDIYPSEHYGLSFFWTLRMPFFLQGLLFFFFLFSVYISILQVHFACVLCI